ncbi:MAG: PAS domain S-box protein [Flavobacteriales bacterium]|nr:PAS domain S-box protein [Flavobacteriales bacterium]
MTNETYRNKPLEEKFLHANIYLSLAVVLLAAAGLLGWQFTIEFLKRPSPNWIAMNPLTAVAFISLGAAFLLLRKQNSHTLSGLGYILATFILLVGLIRLVGVLTGFDLHIDEYLFHQKVAMELTNHTPSRMAPNTAFCFVLIAIAMLILRSVNYRWCITAQLLCLGVALLALFAIIGYSYQAQEFYKVSYHIPMAIQTALGFLLLSMAILFAKPAEGIMSAFTSTLAGSKVTRSIVPLAIILPSMLGFVRLVTQWEGLFTLELGTVALVLSIIFIFLTLVYFAARQLNANDRERLKAEQQLFIKNEWFNQTLVCLGDGVITTDNNGVITLLNKAASELTGWQPEEATGKHIDHIFEIINERTGQKVINPVMEALQQNRIVMLANHTILTKKDGSQLFIDDSGAPIHNEIGEIIGAVLIFRDITEKKKADDEIITLNQTLEKRVEERAAELLKTEQTLSNTLDNMMEGALIVGFDWKIIYTNNAWLRHAKYTRKEVLGFTLMEKFSGYEQTEFYKVQEKCMNERVPVHIENKFTFPDGSEGWFEVTAQPSFEGIFIMTIDITERKKAESERVKMISDIVQRNSDLEQFSYIVSHNLRAPAANIIGLAEILQDETLTSQEQKELLQGLSKSIAALDIVIKDINKILQVKSEVNKKKEILIFSKLVNDIMISIGNLIDKDRVSIISDFSEVDEIYSIKVYIHSIFYNLISNSIKYGKQNEPPLIEIKSKKENGKIILTFKDNGLGIDIKKQGDKIFGLYRRFHSHVEGKGMGLFMVKTQVESLGGKITIASELNKGTEFTIVFEN